MKHLQTCHKSETAGLQSITNQSIDRRLERTDPTSGLFRCHGCGDCRQQLRRRVFVHMAAWVGWLHLCSSMPWTSSEKF